MVQVHNFSYGLLNPGLAYLTSCLGCFLGLQCTARVLGEWVESGDWALADAVGVAEMIGAQNARRVYRLP